MSLQALGPLPELRRLFARDPARQLLLVTAAWPQAVGAELLRRTRPEALVSGVLRVRVPDAQWRNVLHRMQPAVVRRLQALLGELAPRRLSFVEGGVGPAAPPAAPEPPLEPAAPEPLPEAVARAAAAIADPEIRGRFESTAARSLARRGRPRA